MWRVISLLCCLMTVGITAKLPTEYEKGKSANYIYTGFVTTGAPDLSYTHVGFLIETKVKLQHHDSRRFTMLLKDTKISKIANEVSKLNAATLSKENDGAYVGMSKKALELAVEFKWSTAGQVSELKKSPAEETESLNIKRSILSMISGSFGSIADGTKTGKTDWRSVDGVDGVCATSYTYTKTGKKSYEMVKVRDLSNCTSTFNVLLSNINPQDMRRCNNPTEGAQNSRVDSATRTTFELRRSNKDSFIVSSRVDSSYGIDVRVAGRNDQITRAQQELKYDSTSDLENVDTSAFKQTQLTMEQPNFTPIKSEKAFFDAANKVLKQMKSNKYSLKFTNLQVRLLWIFQMAPKDYIQKLVKRESKNKYMTRVIGSILAATGTPASVQILGGILEDSKISDKVAAEIASKSASLSSNPKLLANVYQSIIDNDKLVGKNRPETLKAVLVGVSSLINVLNKNEKCDKTYSALLRKYFNSLKAKDMSKDMTTETKTLTLLMSLGNSGLTGIVDIIESYLQKSNSLVVRLMALRAWRRIGPKMPAKTWDILFPVLSDKTEDTQVRINAFSTIDGSLPSSYHLAIIAQFIRKEKDMNVRNFMVSYYLSISKMPIKSVCNIQMITNAQWILKMLPMKLHQVSITKSRVYMIPLMSGDFVLTLWIQVIQTSDSLIPRSIQMYEFMHLDNRLGELSEFEFSSFDNQNVVREIFNQITKYSKSFKSGGGAKAGTSKNLGKITTRMSTFGDDTSFQKADAMNMMTAMLGINLNSMTFVYDQYMLATSLGMSLSLETVLSYVDLMKSKFDPPTYKNKRMTLNGKSGYSIALLMHSSSGVFAEKGGSFLTYNSGISELADGNTELVERYVIGKDYLSYRALLKPYGKGRQLFTMKESMYIDKLSAKNEIWELERKEIKTFRRTNKRTIKTGGKYGAPIEIKTTMKELSYEEFIKTKFPVLFNLESKDGQVCGFGFEYQTRRKTDKQNLEYEDDGTEANIIKLRKTESSSEMDDVSAYTKMSGSPSISNKDVKMKLNMYVVKDGKPIKSPLASAKVELRQKTLTSSEMKLKVKFGSADAMEMTLKGKDSGPPVFFNPANPFQLTTNMKSTADLNVVMMGKQVFKAKYIMKMSQDWVKGWKRIFDDSKLMSRLYPYMTDCMKNKKSGYKYSNSPDCIRTFDTLQNYDTHKIEMELNPVMAANVRYLVDYFAKATSEAYFTSYSSKYKGNKMTMAGRISPASFGYYQNNRQYQRERILMNGFTGVCDVGIFGKEKQLFVNTFNNQRYSSSVTGDLFNKDKNNNLIITQDRRERALTVTFSYNKVPKTVINYVNGGKNCEISVVGSKTGNPGVDVTGDGCEGESGLELQNSYFLVNSVTINIQSLKVQVITRPGEYARITVGGIFYGEDLRGVCGHHNMEDRSKSWVGKSCERKYFKSPSEFASDYVVEQPKNLPTCN